MNKNDFFKSYKNFILCAKRLSEKTRREGILSLEDEIEDFDDENFKMGLRLLVDGIDYNTTDEIFSNLISYEKDEFVNRMLTIQKRTILGLYRGENTRILYLVLKSYANLTQDENNEIESLLLNDSSDNSNSSDVLDLDD